MARLEKMTEEDFAAPAEHVLSGEPSTVGLQLAGLQFHEAYHVGQTGVLRRFLGNEAVESMRRIKLAFDPNSRFAPGVIFPA